MTKRTKPQELGAAMQQALLRIEKLEQRLQAVFDWIDAQGYVQGARMSDEEKDNGKPGTGALETERHQ